MPHKYKIDILSHGRTVTASRSDLLADKIQEAGVNLSVYCNKKGLCGKCMVEIIEGSVSPLSEKEHFFIKQKNLNLHHRLACLQKIKSDLKINVPEESLLQEAMVLKTGIERPVLVDPMVKKYHLKLQKPEIKAPFSLLELLEKDLKNKKLVISLDLLKELPPILESSQYSVTAVTYHHNQILTVEPGDTINKNYGIAVDIGTTTVVAELVNLTTGESVDTSTSSNSQMRYGSDVVSRISFACLNDENLKKMRDSILNTLNNMINSMLQKNKVKKSHVYEVVIAGNTSMNHFLLGLPVNNLAVSPFSAVFSSLPEFSSSELGFDLSRQGKAYIVPNIKSFVGGDISAGLTASDLAGRKGKYLFIDLGTNGEIVLKRGRRFVATSTAAGPAFEGMNISCGMLALPGAIYKAQHRRKLVFHTIANKPAKGICGTGLIDLMAVFLEKGQISAKGKINNKAGKIPIINNIYINQKDVREMQLAIAAIKTGIRMVLLKNKLKLEQLDGIFIAGAFGNYLNIKNSIKIGLLPPVDENKVIFIGNSSLAGAKTLLLAREARKKIESLVKKIQYFSLATDPHFQEYFVQALNLPDPNLE
ncbi:MAG: ASKHA domain-containing protein [Candidatus Aminicenantes bacterium]